MFWSGHNGTQLDHRTTIRPDDITSWTRVAQIRQGIRGTDGFTYPNPVLLPTERDRLYLFWRGADWSADFATREPDGAWGPARELIRVSGQRPYVKVADNGSDAIALAFTDGHPRNVLSSIYYATYRSGSLWTAAGRWITRLTSAPIAPAQTQVVYNAHATKVPAYGAPGHPRRVGVRCPRGGTPPRGPAVRGVKFLIDAQLPARLAEFLNRAGHDAVHTIGLPDGNRSTDGQTAQRADSDGRVVVTKDQDFRRRSPARAVGATATRRRDGKHHQQRPPLALRAPPRRHRLGAR